MVMIEGKGSLLILRYVTGKTLPWVPEGFFSRLRLDASVSAMTEIGKRA